MRKKGQIAMLVLGIGMLMSTGCGGSQSEKMLYLNFDEGSGNEITDCAHTERKSEVQYRYTNAMYTENMDTQ